jgi:O-antigen/teichoic acid export membrane protein
MLMAGQDKQDDKPGKYIINVSWLMIERVIRMLLTLAVSIPLARYLGPEEFGLLNYVISFVVIFTSVAALGLEGLAVMELVNHPDSRDRILGTTFLLKLSAGILALLLLAACAYLLGNEIKTMLMMLIIAGGHVMQAFDAIDIYFQSRVQSKYVAIVKIVQVLVSTCIKLLLIYLEADLLYFAIAIFIDSFLVSAGLILIYRYFQLEPVKWSFDRELARKFLINATPIIIADIAIIVYMRIDQIMIKEMLGASYVGLYAVATTLSEASYFVPTIIVSTLYPMLIQAKEQGERIYYLRLQQLFNMMVWISVLIALITTFISSALIGLLYGKAYADSAPVLNIQIWSAIFVFLGIASGRWYLIEGRYRHISRRSITGVIVNVLLNYILIPVYGITGAAIASLVAMMFSYYLYDLFTAETRPVFYMKTKSLLFLDRSIYKS